jgi:polysaccharide export outer membrane protein
MAAVLVSACGVSSVSDVGSGSSPLAAAPQAATQPAAASGAGRDATLHQVSLSYTALSDPKSKAYKIGPLDVLDVTVFKVPELSKTIQVSEAGTINFPLIGEVEAGGKSAREVEQLLTKELSAKYLQKPQITVFVKEHNSQRVTVEGEVKKPGVIPMAGGMSLLQAIAQSGGMGEVADSDVVVFRVADGKRSAARYDVAEIRAGRMDDPQLQSGDVIIVPTSDVKQGFNTFLKLVPLAAFAPLL